MSEMTLEQALSGLENVADEIRGEYHYVASNIYAHVEVIRGHLAEARVPVAYRYALETGKWTVFLSKARANFLAEEGAIVEPLYAAPPIADSSQSVAAVDVRLAFERWIRKNTEFDLEKDVNGEYVFAGAGDSWNAWQAALAHPRPTGDTIVGSWSWLRGVLSGMPSREEPIGGQRQRYLNRDEVMAWLDEGERRAGLATGANPAPAGEQAGKVPLWIGGTALSRVNPIQMVRIAQTFARADDEHSYTKVENFSPHNWVVAAMCAAYEAGRQNIIDGTHTEGYTPEVVESVRQAFALAQPRPMGVPAGWKLVPVEPTVAMLAEGRSENLCCNDDADRIYKAMLAAAPVAGGG